MIKTDNIVFRGHNMKIVRDDVFPEVGGGNKARKALEYERDILDKGANAVVTTGGIQSNHCRAIALMCAKRSWLCRLVYHGTRERFLSEKGNAAIVRMTGAQTEFVSENEISTAMDSAMNEFAKKGFSPYYVHGGGHDLAGGIAYVKAVIELRDALGGKWKPDYIFHASGTGSTQAGILVGLEKIGWGDVQVVGISVAREKNRGAAVISSFGRKLAAHLGVDFDDSRVVFTDSFVCGGYEKFTPELSDLTIQAARNLGIIFDTTYSGKAFYGMIKTLETSPMLSDKKILFWHTGGILNMLS